MKPRQHLVDWAMGLEVGKQRIMLEVIGHMDDNQCATYWGVPEAQRVAVLEAAAQKHVLDSASKIQARLPCASRYAAHINSPDGHKEAAVVIDADYVATFRHDHHQLWSEGEEVQVFVHNAGGDQMRSISCTVAHIDDVSDLVLLKASQKLEAPIVDAQLSPGQQYFVLGQCAQMQGDASSACHGIIAATQPDAYAHVRGDLLTGKGDSGAGCFSVDTGRLIGMMVGADHHACTSVLVPGAVIAHALSVVHKL